MASTITSRPRLLAGFSALLLSAVSALAQNFTNIAVFGDSLSDTGTSRFYTSNIPLIATRPVAPNYANGRWTNGTDVNYSNLNLAASNQNSIWHWTMADALGAARAQNQYTGVGNRNNYASGGATTAGGRQTTAGFPTSDNVGYQVNTSFIGAAPAMSASTLYALWGGGNDIRDAVRAGTANDAVTSQAAGAAAANNMAGYITTLATRAQNQNVRITVAWPNVVPIQLIPDFANAYGGNAAWRTNANTAAIAFRDTWTTQIAALTAAFPNNLIIKGINFWQYFTDLLASPGTLNVADPILAFNNFSGFTFNPQRNAAIPANANPDEYVFWDQVHPTARLQALMGTYAASQIPAPVAAVLLVGGVLAVRRRRGYHPAGVPG